MDDTAKSTAPKPICNTRAVGVPTLLLDYIMISIMGASVVDVARYLILPLAADFEIKESSMRGFQQVLTNGVIFLHYGNKGSKEVVVLEIRSAGCRFLEQQEEHSWLSFFRQVSEIAKVVPMERFSVKRIDVAIDSFSKDTLSPERALKYLDQGLVTSRFRTSREICERRIATKEVTGRSIYFGKRSSDFSILSYNKQLESKSQYYWFRTELRFKNDWGQKVMSQLTEKPKDFSNFIATALKKNVQFRSNVHSRSELKRRPLARWYELYLSYVKRQVLFGLGVEEAMNAE